MKAHKLAGEIRAFLIGLVIFAAALPGWTATYYIDYANGNNNNNGLSTAVPFKHCPGDKNATGKAATTVLKAGDVVVFKRGVEYNGQITCAQSGVQIASGFTGTVTAAGVFTDARADFLNAGVKSGDYIYVYNNSQAGTWIESCGLWPVSSVFSKTQIALNGFDGMAGSKAELAYKIYRPITYTSVSSWGTGSATISGGGTRDVCIDLDDQDYIRIAQLRLANLRDIPKNNCAEPQHLGAIFDNANVFGIMIEGCDIENVWSGIRVDGLRYSVIRNCKITHFGYIGLTGGEYGLVENNQLHDGTSGIRSCGKFSLIRFNAITDCNHGSSDYCGAHGDGIGPFFSGGADPNSNRYGWIYGNLISNTVMGIFLEYNNGGTSGWTIHSNILIGHYGAGGSGASAISLNDADSTKVYNNTIFGLNGATGWINSINLTTGSTYCEVKNNLVYSLTSTAPSVGTADNASNTGFVCQGNMYYTPNRSTPFGLGGVAKTWAQWNALGYDTGGNGKFGTDPLFVDIVGKDWFEIDLRLQQGSPARNSPYSLSVLTRDAAKNLRAANTNWDKGAYEYGNGSNLRPPEPPRNLRVVP